MLSGDNSILQKATDTKTNSDNAQIKERIQLAYLSGLSRGNGSIDKGNFLLELQKEFGAKKVTEDNIVESEDEKKWTVTIDGATVELEVGSTIAQNPQEPEIPSLPKDTGTKPYKPKDSFTQVAGTDLSTGLVITDAVDTEGKSIGNEYVWIEVPSTYVDAGATGGPNYSQVLGTDDYTHIEAAMIAYVETLLSGTDYKDGRMGWKDKYYSECGISTPTDYDNLYHSMLTSVYTNGGFWIGRFEAGSGTARNEGNSASGITPLSKQDLYPINYVTCVLNATRGRCEECIA